MTTDDRHLELCGHAGKPFPAQAKFRVCCRVPLRYHHIDLGDYCLSSSSADWPSASTPGDRRRRDADIVPGSLAANTGIDAISWARLRACGRTKRKILKYLEEHEYA
jgi:hypothetical protein